MAVAVFERCFERFTLRLLAAIFFVVTASTAMAQAVLPVPVLDARVIDQTGTLDAATRQALDAKLAAFEQKKGSQIVVLMVPTTQPEDISSYANRVASTWKIGRKEVGDGVLVIVAKDDRKMRIEVARTLEGAVPDLTAARIVDEQMKPRFRDNDFAGGIGAAVDQLVAIIGGEPLPEVARPSAQRGGGFNWPELGIFLFFGVFAVGRMARSILGNKLGPIVTGLGAGVIAMVVTSSILLAVAAGFISLLFTLFSGALSLPSIGTGGRRGGAWGGAVGGGLGGGFGGGFGGGSSGGGGFGSGGGGSFGGGGASGGW